VIRRLRRTLRVARWEAARASGGIDRQTLLVGLVLLAAAGGVVGAGVATGTAGLDVDQDVYRVGVDAESPYSDAVEADPALTPVARERATLGETVDLVVRGQALEGEDADGAAAGRVVVDATDTPKGDAAAAAFREAVEAHNERLMTAEPNETAAFPVTVTLRYASRTGDTAGGRPAASQDPNDAETGDGGSGDEGTDAGGDDASEGGGADAGSGDDGDADSTDDSNGFAVPSLGGETFGAGSTGSPAAITPPFPFASLVLAFAFLVPMNFLAQAYGSSVLDERTNRRGEPLLVTPLSPAEIVAGKTLPYVAAAVAVTSLIALVVGGGLASVVAVTPLAVAFLAATFVGAVFARSFKELTFVTVAVSVLLTSFAFVPAIFTNVTPVALISPLTLVVFDLQGEPVSLGETLFATGPTAIAAVLLFGLGLGVYREEDLFTQKPVTRKTLDALAVRLSAVGEGVRESPPTGLAARLPKRARGLAAVAVLTACTIPFVFVAELLAVAVLFALPVTVSIPILLVAIALVEEVAKSLHLYAGFERGVFARTDRVAVAVGLASGLGFFLAEKATAAAQAVGLTELYVGRAAFGAAAGAGGLSPLVLAGLVLAPLALHGTTATISAVGARRSRTAYAATLAAATLVHAAYNLGVMRLYG
jgi:ABC-type Na+ efflux pump permease subunit